MKKLFTIIFFSLFVSVNSHSSNLDITSNYKKIVECKFEKIIIKNQEYNYQTFVADQIKDNRDIKISIKAIKSKKLRIIGLSDFFNSTSNGSIYDTQVLKNDTILLRVLSKDQNYSESVFISKSTGEMLHEITTDIKSENKGKEISFFNCDMSQNL
tara:strand:- start:64 stop:531 length:468 start_codon:yes stop_codon:yes gene_type:complete